MTVAGDPADSGDVPGLHYSYDDPSRPTRLTVYDDSEDAFLACRWITVDVGHAVVLDEMA